MQNNSIKIHRNSTKIQESIEKSIEIPKQSRIHQNSRYNNTNNNNTNNNNTNNNKMTMTVDKREGFDSSNLF